MPLVDFVSLAEMAPPMQVAPLAPLPEDPTRCRWCHGRLRALMDGDPVTYCQRGCADNHIAPYLLECGECGKHFHTGKPGATLCHGCEQAEARLQPNEPARVYRFELYRRGGYRA